MGWFNKKGNQDFGDYLPDEKAELKTEEVIIQAYNYPDAKAKCNAEAKVFDGFDAEPEKGENKGEWNCKFKFWG